MPELFPRGLLNWAGQRSGGVRRLFHNQSGRPAGSVIDTPLLLRVRKWAQGLVAEPTETPRVLMLVGGPGNGKTEAVEAAVAALDTALHKRGDLEASLRAAFNRDDNGLVPRLASVTLREASDHHEALMLHIVQDASARDPARGSASPAELLLEDLETVALQSTGASYLACVNRGILDDALIAAREGGRDEVVRLIEATIRSASLSSEPVACWPLSSFPWVAVWPMDVESLMTEGVGAATSAAAQLLDKALDGAAWTTRGSCAAKECCPHCSSREILATPEARGSLLTLLHWYELASGKRWTFRDLNSLLSYLLAGAHAEAEGGGDPCEWAAKQVAALDVAHPRAKVRRQLAPFLIVAAQYQHALFSVWDGTAMRSRLDDLRTLTKGDPSSQQMVDTIEGLIRFLSDGRASRVPATLAPLLKDLCDALDPALAAPEQVFYEGERTKTLQQLDVRFSQSVDAGFNYVRSHKWLTPAEVDLLRRLSEADGDLSRADIRRKAPASAGRLQLLLRDFACRLVRRSIGTRKCLVRDAPLLTAYAGVSTGSANLLHVAAKQVEALLNNRDRFELCLNTTFGEPLPPGERRATLRTLKQRVRPALARALDRPESMTRFITVGSGSAAHAVPMTFELYRAVTELNGGLLPASLPRAVVALLDATRARLAGMVVRDEEALDDADIILGQASEVVAMSQGQFVVHPLKVE